MQLFVLLRLLIPQFDSRFIKPFVAASRGAVFEYFCFLKIHQCPLLLCKQDILKNLQISYALDVGPQI